MSSEPLRIANAQAFWGDRPDGAKELLEQVPELDYLTLDYLAEVSLSILANQRARDPKAGYPRDFVELFTSLIPYWKSGGRCKLITNAGGLDPRSCAEACMAKLVEHKGPALKIAVVFGDDVLAHLKDTASDNDKSLTNLDTGAALSTVRDRLITANAYMGADGIVAALRQGADIVITGRVADPSLTVAPCIYHFDWKPDDWNRIAAAMTAGHLIECGTQATGGISTDWLELDQPERIGFPIIEMSANGTFVVTKPIAASGIVSIATVTEQLVYEIGDPARVLTPDVAASFVELKLEQVGPNRVRVSGARGAPPTNSYKVSATYRDGYRAAGTLTIFGRDAVQKAKRCGDVVLKRVAAKGLKWRKATVECLGAGVCAGGALPGFDPSSLRETVLRIAMEADEQPVLEVFSKQLMPLVTAGPQGVTGYAEGRPRIHPIFRYWPCLIDRDRVKPVVELLETPASLEQRPAASGIKQNMEAAATTEKPVPSGKPSSSPKRLGDIAFARSGDKGTSANIGVIARNPPDYAKISKLLTPQRIQKFLANRGAGEVERFELPNLYALNFLVHDVLANSLSIDAQGKTLGQVLLEMPLLEIPREGNAS